MATSALRQPATRASRRPWAWWLFGLTLAAHGSYVALLRQDPERGYPHPNVIQGAPFADARTWFDMGKDLGAGRGIHVWSGRRPGYAFFLGMLFTVGGPSYNLALAANVLALALGVALVFVVLHELYGPIAGAVGVLSLLATPESLGNSATTLSEPWGLALLLWHFRELLRGSANGSLWTLGLAGAWLGLSNGVRTLTLLAAPLEALALVVLAWRLGRGWRAGLREAVAFTLGTTLVIGAFVGWNYYRNGILALSDNAALDLYAVAHPDHGAWTFTIDADLGRRGLFETKDRYDFLAREARAYIAADPGRFVRRVVGHLDSAATRIGQQTLGSASLWLGLFVAAFAPGTAWRWRRLAAAGLLCASAATFAIVVPRGPAMVVGAAVIWGLLGRSQPAATLLACLFLGTLAAVGMFGSMMERLFMMFEWTALGLTWGALADWASRLAGGGPRVVRWAHTPWPAEPAWLGRLGWCGAFVAMALGGTMAARNLAFRPVPTPAPPPSQVVYQALLEPAVERAPELFSPLELEWASAHNGLALEVEFGYGSRRAGRLVALVGWVDEEPIFFPPGKCVHGAYLAHAPRPYPRSVCRLISFNPDGSSGGPDVLIPGDRREWSGRPWLVIGRLHTDPRCEAIIECLVACPWDPVSGRFRRDLAVHAWDEPAHRQILAALRPRSGAVDPSTSPSTAKPDDD